MKRAVLSTIICFAFGACLMAQDLKLNSLEYFERQGVNVLLQVEDPEFDTWCDRVIAAQEEAKRMCTN